MSTFVLVTCRSKMVVWMNGGGTKYRSLRVRVLYRACVRDQGIDLVRERSCFWLNIVKVNISLSTDLWLFGYYTKTKTTHFPVTIKHQTVIVTSRYCGKRKKIPWYIWPWYRHFPDTFIKYWILNILSSQNYISLKLFCSRNKTNESPNKTRYPTKTHFCFCPVYGAINHKEHCICIKSQTFPTHWSLFCHSMKKHR